MATVLIVEDEAMVRQIVALEFADAGFAVIEAEDGDSAARLIEEGAAPDLLFTDVRLPGALDGFALAERVRAARPDLPVIYATGFTPDALRLVPGSRFFRKPYRTAEVLAAARALGVAG